MEIITKAFNFAKQAHKGVRRLFREPYILHPIAVAQIACEENMGLGSTSICAALLHDVEEDTDYTNEHSQSIWAEVADIVEGLTKIQSLSVFGDRDCLQARTFKVATNNE